MACPDECSVNYTSTFHMQKKLANHNKGHLHLDDFYKNSLFNSKGHRECLKWADKVKMFWC